MSSPLIWKVRIERHHISCRRDDQLQVFSKSGRRPPCNLCTTKMCISSKMLGLKIRKNQVLPVVTFLGVFLNKWPFQGVKMWHSIWAIKKVTNGRSWKSKNSFLSSKNIRIHSKILGGPLLLASKGIGGSSFSAFSIGLDWRGLFFHTKSTCQLMVNWWFGARWFGYLGSPYERDCYLGAPFESQTTGPQTTNLQLVDGFNPSEKY